MEKYSYIKSETTIESGKIHPTKTYCQNYDTSKNKTNRSKKLDKCTTRPSERSKGPRHQLPDH